MNSALIPVVSHALPPMQWALAGAKRLECGSLLPLCLYAQPTYLEPDRHDGENNVSVPISASMGLLRRLRQPRIGTRDNFAGHAAIRGQNPNNEPVTLSNSPPNVVLL
ncbi:MAG TPA: hypothetical protein PLW35_06995 [Verrucomicrobiota bacterium]|nr:hypothetical protein [Verrucomicrobiota bacterium]